MGLRLDFADPTQRRPRQTGARASIARSRLDGDLCKLTLANSVTMSVSIADALTQDLVMLSRLVARFFAPHQIRRQVKSKDAFDGTLFEASRLSASNIRRSMSDLAGAGRLRPPKAPAQCARCADESLVTPRSVHLAAVIRPELRSRIYGAAQPHVAPRQEPFALLGSSHQCSLWNLGPHP